MSDSLRSYYTRWQRLEEEKAALAEELKELFKQAKGEGLDTKALRAAFRLKAKQEAETDDDREHQAIVDTYLAALRARDTREASTEE